MTHYTEFPSYDVLRKTCEALESIDMLREGLLWGSWARYFATGRDDIRPEDTDLIISKKLCEKFYDLAIALRKVELHPVWRIPDAELDGYLEAQGLKQDHILSNPPEPQHGTAWGTCPNVKHGPTRKAMGLNLDLIFDTSGSKLIPNSSGWKEDADHDTWVSKLVFWSGCEELFESKAKSEVGLFYPSRESQIRFNRKLLDRTIQHELSTAKIATALAQFAGP